MKPYYNYGQAEHFANGPRRTRVGESTGERYGYDLDCDARGYNCELDATSQDESNSPLFNGTYFQSIGSSADCGSNWVDDPPYKFAGHNSEVHFTPESRTLGVYHFQQFWAHRRTIRNRLWVVVLVG